MDGQFNLNDDLGRIPPEQGHEYLKAHMSGRDPRTGRFMKNHSGNRKGRPPQKTTLKECFNKSFSKKITVKTNDGTASITRLQAACDKLLTSAISGDDTKLLLQLLKAFGPNVNLADELPKPNPKNDPWYDESVEKIKKALLKQVDEEL